MPLSLITGKPGTGKTLWAIKEIRSNKAYAGREVYYHGIPELSPALGWKPLDDPQKWHECPAGSVIVIDEVQKLWRARPAGSAVPLPVQEIETHRHRGHDLFWLTQDALLVDQNVRKFVDKHYYLKRIFGLEASTLYSWNQRVARVESTSEYHDAMSEKFLFPKDVYKLYKSADVHTVKPSVPWKRIAMIGGAVCLLFGMFWFLKHHWGADGGDQPKGQPAQASGGSSFASIGGGSRVANPWDPKYRLPRINNVQSSAPMYDELQRPAAQPKPVGCWSMRYGDGKVDCRCSTAQGSRVEITVRACLKMVSEGWFDPTRRDVDIKAENIAYLNARDRAGQAASMAAAAAAGPARPAAVSSSEAHE